MDKSVQITLIIVAGFVILGALGYTAFQSLIPDSNTITGNGEATINTVLDLVTVYFNVETKDTDADDARDANAEIVDELITNLIKFGFERKDIQTQNFNLRENFRWVNGNQFSDGYIATHMIRLEMPTSDTGKIGNAIDVGVDAGAEISYINFELSQEKQNQYKAEAIKLAAQDAQLKAEALAEGLNRKLGKLVSVSSSSFDYYPWRLYESIAQDNGESAKTATTNIQPSEQEIRASVTARFKIK